MTTDALPAVNELDFEGEVLAATLPVLVDFTAAWCASCRSLKPILRELALEHAATLRIVTVDGDESPGLAQRFGVRGFPTLLVFIGGREVARTIGLTNKQNLLKLLASARAAAPGVF